MAEETAEEKKETPYVPSTLAEAKRQHVENEWWDAYCVARGD